MTEQLKPNTVLAHYRIVSKIGSGGMGEVYEAEDTKLGRRVAIKFLHEKWGRDEDKLDRFIQEAKAASALNHPNILTVYEIGEVEGTHYIATELIGGMTLREYLSNYTPISRGTVLRIASQLADALVDAHEAGIIHRDIKPENIMVRRDGYVKLLDFGLAKLAEEAPQTLLAGQVDTTPGLVMGTVSYMSPEQARGKKLDPRSDIFSLGVVLYEMLTGRPPFHGETNSHALVSLIEHQPPSMEGSSTPPELEDFVSQTLAKNPDERIQSAREFGAIVERFRRQLDLQIEIERSQMPNEDDSAAITKIFHSQTPVSNANAIAVLPFVNISPGQDGDYFSDGLAEELLNVLSKIRGLRVAARTSAFSFKGKSTTIAEIGRKLNVSSVLEGSVRTAPGRVRIAVQLAKVADGYQLWSETYDRAMDDIFAVQDDIAKSVVEELRTRLLDEQVGVDTERRVVEEVADAVRGRAANPEAQRLMLLGRYLLDRTNSADSERAVEYFRQALDLDPNYALGWAELGRTFAVQAGKAWIAVNDGYGRARDATLRALEIEPDLAEAHALLGRIHSAYDINIRAARASYAKALEHAPGSSVVIDGASILEFKLGNFDAALEMSRQVLAQDPLSGAVWHNLGLICHAAGLLEESERAFRRALELGRNRTVTTAMLSLVILDQGRQEKALQKAGAEPDIFWRGWAESIILNRLGRTEDADAALAIVLRDSTDGDAYQIAEIYGMRGESDEAFAWLNRAAQVRDPGISHAKVAPSFRSLHSDERWQPFLTRIGLSD